MHKHREDALCSLPSTRTILSRGYTPNLTRQGFSRDRSSDVTDGSVTTRALWLRPPRHRASNPFSDFQLLTIQQLAVMSIETQERSSVDTPLTVHHFANRASSQPSSQHLLQSGKRIAKACTAADGWHYPAPLTLGRSFGMSPNAVLLGVPDYPVRLPRAMLYIHARASSACAWRGA